MRGDPVAVDPAYRYSATVLGVPHDGDTFRASVDLGFGVAVANAPFRLAGLNARELSMPGGPEARDNLAAILRPGSAVTLTSVKTDKYARYDAVILLGDGTNLNEWLIANDWAAAWNGKGVSPVPPWPRERP